MIGEDCGTPRELHCRTARHESQQSDSVSTLNIRQRVWKKSRRKSIFSVCYDLLARGAQVASKTTGCTSANPWGTTPAGTYRDPSSNLRNWMCHASGKGQQIGSLGNSGSDFWASNISRICKHWYIDVLFEEWYNFKTNYFQGHFSTLLDWCTSFLESKIIIKLHFYYQSNNAISAMKMFPHEQDTSSLTEDLNR